jgi:isoleucyl-tRNA synthetase
MDYSKTLNLPETNFPMKADPAELELGVLNIWKDLNIYQRRQRSNKGKPRFTVHNPPRPAYGHVCINDALSMILKDIIVKYKLIRGFDVPHFPSWNCYTPAVEREAFQLLGSDANGKVRESEVRKRCRSLCSEYIALQKEQFQRLGIFAYWDKRILTSGSNHESRMIEAFGELYESGYLHKGAKPTRWCINCQTDLAETETEYRDYRLLSLYVKFPVLCGLEELGEDVYMVVWTNTPWTLPANTAVTVHPDHDYVAVEHTLQENMGKIPHTPGRNEILIMAAKAVEDILQKTQDARQEEETPGLESSSESRVLSFPYRIVKKMKGSELDKIVYAHPLLDRDSDVLLDRHVSLTRGTGCVHAAPRRNQADYAVGQQRDLEIISAVDQYGRLTEEAGQFCGLNVFESSDLIALELEKRGCLLASESVEQPYPHCSYCEQPIIVRVADRWIFDLNAGNLRQRILKIVGEVNWIPGWGKDRISDTIANRPDWSVSRRRIWGIPAPVFYCSKCNSQIDTLEGINASKNMISRKGVNRWLTARPNDILSDDVICNRCGGRDFRWETDILDGEFISVMSYKAPALASDTRRKTQDARHKTQDTRRKTQDTRQEEGSSSLESRVLSLESRVLSLESRVLSLVSSLCPLPLALGRCLRLIGFPSNLVYYPLDLVR